MFKAIAAIVTAAVVAALVIVLPGLPEVSAHTPDQAGVREPAAKADRLPVPALGATCSPRAWPYYERDCLFAARWHGDARKVRVVTTDRIGLDR